MRKLNIVFSFLLLGSIFMGLAFYPLFVIRQELARSEMNNFIHSGQKSKAQVEILLTESEYKEIRWLEKGQEFRYNGDLLDVVSITEKSDGSYKLIAISDAKEKQLLEESDEYSKTASKISVKLLLEIFSSPVPDASIMNVHNLNEGKMFFLDLICSFSSNTQELSTPPPERV